MRKLSDNDYTRPKLTSTDKLTNEDIQDLLEDYKEEDITKIPLGTHVRYFQEIDGQMKFRRGGFLKHNLGLPKYVMLDNKANTWSVQINKRTVFYRKMTLSEIKNEYEERIMELENKINELELQLSLCKK